MQISEITISCAYRSGVAGRLVGWQYAHGGTIRDLLQARSHDDITRLQARYNLDLATTAQADLHHHAFSAVVLYPIYILRLAGWHQRGFEHRSEERRVGKECRSRWAAEH